MQVVNANRIIAGPDARRSVIGDLRDRRESSCSRRLLREVAATCRCRSRRRCSSGRTRTPGDSQPSLCASVGLSSALCASSADPVVQRLVAGDHRQREAEPCDEDERERTGASASAIRRTTVLHRLRVRWCNSTSHIMPIADRDDERPADDVRVQEALHPVAVHRAEDERDDHEQDGDAEAGLHHRSAELAGLELLVGMEGFGEAHCGPF